MNYHKCCWAKPPRPLKNLEGLRRPLNSFVVIFFFFFVCVCVCVCICVCVDVYFFILPHTHKRCFLVGKNIFLV